MGNRTVPIALASVVLLAGAGAGPVNPASAAKTYKACVKKSTGEMRMLLGKRTKCRKGWKQQTWTKAGPKGAPGGIGAANSFGNVVDSTGAKVGQLLQSIPTEDGSVFVVGIDSSLFAYASSGRLMPSPLDPLYDNVACSGTPFIVVDSAPVKNAILQDSSTRIVKRAITPTWGQASAYKFSGAATDVVNLPSWEFGTDGSCTPASAQTGIRLDMTEVPAPPDHPGPLRIG